MSRRRQIMQAVSGIAPPDIDNVLLWYDADDASTFSFSSGTTISEWRDKSGNDHHLSTGFAERNGSVNGRTAVAFTAASSHYLSAAVGLTNHISRPWSIFVVANCDLNDAIQRLCCGFTSGGGGTRVGDGRLYRPGGGNVSLFQGGVLGSTAWGTGLHSIACSFNGASSKVSVDNAAFTTGNAGTGSTGGIFRVGHYGTGDVLTPASPFEYWDGNICEIMVTTDLATDADLAEWDAYATEKWGA